MIPQGMKPFSIEEWEKGGKPICRDGYEPDDLYYFKKSKGYCLSFTTKEGILVQADSDGRYYSGQHSSMADLFLKAEKKEGWVNLYKSYKNIPRLGELVFESEQDAKECSGEEYLTTVKIEWYE